MTQTLCQNYSRQELFQHSLAVTTLEFRAGCVELIASQFQSQGEKISYRRIHLQNLRGHPDGFAWLVKNRADFSSAQNTQLIEGFFAGTELLALAGVDSLVLVGQKRDRGKLKLGRPL